MIAQQVPWPLWVAYAAAVVVLVRAAVRVILR